MKKIDFEALQAVKKTAPMQQKTEQEETQGEDKKLLLSYPENWDNQIKKKSIRTKKESIYPYCNTRKTKER